jgi:hypothetical protein
MNPLLRFALGLANVPEKEVDDLAKQLPALGRLIAAAKDMKADLELAGPHLQAIEPHIDALLPVAERLIPKVKVLWPDLVAVWPVMEEFTAIAQK